MSDKTGILLCGHGSRLPAAGQEFAQVARLLGQRMPKYDLEPAFLELSEPAIPDGLDALYRKGNKRILVVPGILFSAGHLKRDIPAIIDAYKAKHPGLRIDLGRELGVDTKMLEAAAARVQEAIDNAKTDCSPQDTVLAVVGRGAKDPDANANIFTAMRYLWERFGFGWGEVAYSGVTFPRVEATLQHAARLGYKRIAVFPYILFSGALVKGIHECANLVAAEHPAIDIVNVEHFKDHPLVIETFVERAQELLDHALKQAE